LENNNKTIKSVCCAPTSALTMYPLYNKKNYGIKTKEQKLSHSDEFIASLDNLEAYHGKVRLVSPVRLFNTLQRLRADSIIVIFIALESMAGESTFFLFDGRKSLLSTF
jgi:hypothetical protein